ncbi:bifunctional uridylate/adenylate kinase [Turnera subulata]|uniref:UMP-CMP kinase n=1 Tax=Turnera subulata TaxID=218843 RepID=A0A9Q0FF32_9ROSI|nr:bifunctional uridylate/adenylate kinase [Turnera subulata]
MAPPAFPSQEDTSNNFLHDATVVFVLGGPASGKGTQCPKIVENFGFTYISAGDLLKAEVKSGCEVGIVIQNFIKEGKIVPSEVTLRLIEKAMQQSENKKFIIDGFPRNEENRVAFENIMKIEPALVLFFDCPEEELTRRMLNRNQGRIDDNIETIPKRLKVYFESTLPVIHHYSSKGKVRKIDAGRSIDEVFEDVKRVFLQLECGSLVNSVKE